MDKKSDKKKEDKKEESTVKVKVKETDKPKIAEEPQTTKRPKVVEKSQEVEGAKESERPEETTKAKEAGAGSGAVKEKKKPKILTATELLGSKDVSIIRLVDSLVENAFGANASDIHIDPDETQVRVRLRIDGVMHDTFTFSKDLHSEIITRIKVLSGLRTDEHQAAQDGRFKVPLKNHQNIDIRVSIAPTYYGENAVLRILAEQAVAFTLEGLGFSEKDRERVKQAIARPYGMVLCTGPTGSGKTTTLYTIIKMLSTPEISIITIEDPIEYSIPGIEQIQANARAGLTFASGLRSILRQDPNVIMVGEIRDEETAGIAVNAALTGHLLLSTIHTNDSATTLPRLIDMGIEPFLIASTVNIAIAQRLVRKICLNCKEELAITEAELKSLTGALPPDVVGSKPKFYKGKGCEKCNDSGYKGRIGIYEVMVIDDAVREAIMQRIDASEIKKIAMKNGMTTMLEDGFQKALAGITTIEEILRVVYE